MKHFMRMFGVVLAGFLSACDEGPSVVVEQQSGGPVWPHVVTALKDNGSVLTAMYGDPFGEATSTVTEQVIDGMTQTINDRQITFSTDAANVTSQDIRVIMLLGTPEAMSRKKLCQVDNITEDNLIGTGSDGKVRTLGVLCINNDRRLFVRGWVKGVTSTADKRFRLLMQQTVREMFKKRQP